MVAVRLVGALLAAAHWAARHAGREAFAVLFDATALLARAAGLKGTRVRARGGWAGWVVLGLAVWWNGGSSDSARGIPVSGGQ